MSCCLQKVSNSVLRNKQGGLCPLSSCHGHYGGSGPRVDSLGKGQHRVPANIPFNLCLTEAQVSTQRRFCRNSRVKLIVLELFPLAFFIFLMIDVTVKQYVGLMF